MSTFVFRLGALRPTFALDMSEEESEVMARHAAHWQPWIESGQMVIFGPVLDAGGSWGPSSGAISSSGVADVSGQLAAHARLQPPPHAGTSVDRRAGG